MCTITGITGKVGGILARELLEAGQTVRAVVRDAEKGRAWADRGCRVAIAEMEDAEAMTEAFAGSEAVFILPPSEFDPEPGYPEAQRVIDAVRVEIVPRYTWETLFRGQGMKNPLPRMRMLDGFNEGWIDFPGNSDLALKGIVSAETVISNLVRSNC